MGSSSGRVTASGSGKGIAVEGKAPSEPSRLQKSGANARNALAKTRISNWGIIDKITGSAEINVPASKSSKTSRKIESENPGLEMADASSFNGSNPMNKGTGTGAGAGAGPLTVAYEVSSPIAYLEATAVAEHQPSSWFENITNPFSQSSSSKPTKSEQMLEMSGKKEFGVEPAPEVVTALRKDYKEIMENQSITIPVDSGKFEPNQPAQTMFSRARDNLGNAGTRISEAATSFGHGANSLADGFSSRAQKTAGYLGTGAINLGNSAAQRARGLANSVASAPARLGLVAGKEVNMLDFSGSQARKIRKQFMNENDVILNTTTSADGVITAIDKNGNVLTLNPKAETEFYTPSAKTIRQQNIAAAKRALVNAPRTAQNSTRAAAKLSVKAVQSLYQMMPTVKTPEALQNFGNQISDVFVNSGLKRPTSQEFKDFFIRITPKMSMPDFSAMLNNFASRFKTSNTSTANTSAQNKMLEMENFHEIL